MPQDRGQRGRIWRGSDMLITACPLCMYNLNKNTSTDLPVYYFTELLAEALGVKDEVKKA